MGIMTSDRIDHLYVPTPNSSELIHLSHRMRWSFEEFRFSEEANRPPLQKIETPQKVKE